MMRRRRQHRWTPPTGEVTHGSLTARCLGSTGPPVVLLHGMLGSNLYWGGEVDALGTRARLVAVDLLGFGDSPKPGSGYGPRGHADAVAVCLRELGIDEPAIVVGHSMGTLVALALVRHHPEAVTRVIAIAPPIFATRADAVRHIRATGTLEGLLAFGRISKRMCAWMCRHRELAGRLATLIDRDLPPAVARAAVQHIWESYSQSMEELLLSADSCSALLGTTRPVHLIVAMDDPVPDLPLLSRLREASDLISLEIWATGGHHLPLTHAARCVAAIERILDNPDSGGTAPSGDGPPAPRGQVRPARARRASRAI